MKFTFFMGSLKPAHIHKNIDYYYDQNWIFCKNFTTSIYEFQSFLSERECMSKCNRSAGAACDTNGKLLQDFLNKRSRWRKKL